MFKNIVQITEFYNDPHFLIVFEDKRTLISSELNKDLLVELMNKSMNALQAIH